MGQAGTQPISHDDYEKLIACQGMSANAPLLRFLTFGQQQGVS